MGTLPKNTTLLEASKGTPSDTTPAQVGAPPRAVSFNEKLVTPPSLVYIDRDDTILVRVFNSTAGNTIRISARLLLANGQINRTQAIIPITGNRVENDFIVTLAEGYLLSLVIDNATVAPVQGQCYVEALLFQGPALTGFNEELLCFGYVSALNHVGYPNGTNSLPATGTGFIHSVQVANPAAGADWTFTVPTTTRMRIVSLAATLTTAVAVANREPQIIIDDGVNTYWEAEVAVNIPASTVNVITATALSIPNGIVTTTQNIPIPPALILPNGHRLRTNTVGIQAADQWSAIWILLEEWISQ